MPIFVNGKCTYCGVPENAEHSDNCVFYRFFLEKRETVERRFPLAEPEMVDHPKHYNTNPSGVECIDVIEHLNFNMGSAIKYIWRADDKANPIEDLRKAAWYVNREIEKRTRERSKTD